MPIGNALAQTNHASLEAGKLFPQPELTPYIYILEVANEEELLKEVEKIKDRGIQVVTFFEPDFPRGYTAAVTEPLSKNKRRIFKNYKLYGS